MLLIDEPVSKYWEKRVEVAARAIARGKSFLVSGPAGSGKSTFMRELKKRLGTTAALTSTTGISALNVGGQTIHSFAGIGIYSDPRAVHAVRAADSWPHVRARINSVETVIIDEISMLRGDTFDLLNAVFKLATCDSRPFGGKTIVAVGDFLQLPPIPKMEDVDGDIWVFQSKSWRDLKPYPLILKKIHRHAEPDFLNALSDLRSGKCSDETNKFFQLRNLPRAEVSKNTLKFFPTNIEAAAFNQKCLLELSEKSLFSKAETWAKTPQLEAQIRSNCVAVEILELKIGARVMVLINCPDGQYVNGSFGTVVAFQSMLPIVRIDRTGIEFKFEPYTWEQKNYKGELLASLTQLPLKLAYAVTIHKSQGLTLDSASIDCRRIFAAGQLYVALSRVKSSKGLILNGWNRNLVRADDAAKDFYKKINDRRGKNEDK
jgi:ATP-dependent DNA helicase PIF1